MKPFRNKYIPLYGSSNYTRGSIYPAVDHHHRIVGTHECTINQWSIQCIDVGHDPTDYRVDGSPKVYRHCPTCCHMLGVTCQYPSYTTNWSMFCHIDTSTIAISYDGPIIDPLTIYQTLIHNPWVWIIQYHPPTVLECSPWSLWVLHRRGRSKGRWGPRRGINYSWLVDDIYLYTCIHICIHINIYTYK